MNCILLHDMNDTLINCLGQDPLESIGARSLASLLFAKFNTRLECIKRQSFIVSVAFEGSLSNSRSVNCL